MKQVTTYINNNLHHELNMIKETANSKYNTKLSIRDMLRASIIILLTELKKEDYTEKEAIQLIVHHKKIYEEEYS